MPTPRLDRYGRSPSDVGRRVVLGVGGGIAAYKAADLLRKLTEAGHDVTVVPTAAALQLRRRRHLGRAVAPSGRAPTSGPTPPRCRTSRSAAAADLVVVAPATADLLARAAHGLADDLLTNTLLTARCPGAVRAGDAHRDVGAPGHRRQRRDAAPPRRGRARAGDRPAHRRRHRQGPAGRSRPRSPSWPSCCCRGPTRCRAT